MEENNKNYKQMQDNFLNEIYKEAVEKNSTDAIKQLKEIVPENVINQKKQIKKVVEEYIPEVEDFEEDDEEMYEETQSYDCPYDMVSLPSKGLIYGKSFRQSKIAVGYLNGSDEDAISSPNLYSDTDSGLLFNTILRRKILDKNIKPELLSQGDRDAILLFLRGSAYSNNYKIIARDEDDIEFESEVDLNDIKSKEFLLIPNNNGYFEFVMPKSKDLIEFRFLVYKDEVEYNKFLQKTNIQLKKYTLNMSNELIRDIISSDKNIDKNKKKKIDEALNTINEYVVNIVDNDDVVFTKGITYRLEKSIVSVNGEKDRRFIHNYVNQILAFDSLAFRRHVAENIPSLDLMVPVKKPESLGGGTIMKQFQYGLDLFVNY